jgi:hypothetical protein
MSAPPNDGPPSGGAPPFRLAGGVVACNEERNVVAAIRSLLDQTLPDGVQWGTIWVVASGCTDGTVRRAQEVSEGDSRVRLIVEPDRRGKASALDLVLRLAEGNALVLLNADARAEPGSVSVLVESARGRRAPFAIMARSVVGEHSNDLVGRITRLQWSLHHEFHLASLGEGGGNHLSDELLLLSLPGIPDVPIGVINDGSYFGAWLDRHGGDRVYAPRAEVTIQVPRTLKDHLTQRRRILVGHVQVSQLVGRDPSTLRTLVLADPVTALRVIRRALHGGQGHILDLLLLGVPEMAASFLSVWDRIPPRRDHTRWQRVQHPSSW